MAISLKTHLLVWIKAAHRCAFPGCGRELITAATPNDDPSLFGEVCHIVAKRADGPRGDSPLTDEERDQHDNLVLLCGIHHKVVDDQVNTYTIKRLREMKAAHEASVSKHAQVTDPRKEDDELIYAGYVDEWAERARIADWEAWGSWVLAHGQPALAKEVDASLRELRDWLFNRIWPGRYPELESAFHNFRRVLSDFLRVFHERAEEKGDMLWTQKFYHIDKWDPQLHNRLYREFSFHVALVEDLFLELTRAGNYLCDQIRRYLDASFRVNEGALVVESGPHMDMNFRRYRPEYTPELRTSQPYPGLEQYKVDRKYREFHSGEGTSPDDPSFRVGG